MSCAAAGNCVAGGSYTDGHRHQQGFAAVEKNGRWGKAIEVPGLGALNQGRLTAPPDLLSDLVTDLNAGRIADTNRRD